MIDSENIDFKLEFLTWLYPAITNMFAMTCVVQGLQYKLMFNS